MFPKPLPFRENIEDPTPFLMAVLLVFDVWRFPQEALKFPDNFLTVSARSGLSVPSDLIRGLCSCLLVV